MLKTFVFRTAGGKGIGFGHFYRSFSLARALFKWGQNVKIIFMINRELVDRFVHSEFEYIVSESFGEDIAEIEELKSDLFILDSYLANNDYLAKVKKTTKLMIFDDNNDIFDSTIPDILLNGNIHAEGLIYRKNPNSLYLVGPKYLVMKEEFWGNNDIKYENKSGVLVTTGGTDPYHISYNLLMGLRQLSYEKRIVIGPGYEPDLIVKLEKAKDEKTELIYQPDSLCKYIRESKVAVTAGGSTIYEVISQHTIPIIFSMADNQDLACHSFADLGVVYIGKYPEISYDDLEYKLQKSMEESSTLSNESIFSLIDGQGAKRVVEMIFSFFQWGQGNSDD